MYACTIIMNFPPVSMPCVNQREHIYHIPSCVHVSRRWALDEVMESASLTEGQLHVAPGSTFTGEHR